MHRRELLQNLCPDILIGLAAPKPTSAPQPPVKAVGLTALHVSGQVHYDKLESFVPAAAPRAVNILREGDVLLAVRGSLPKAALVQGLPSAEIYATANLGILRAGPGLDPYYLWAALAACCAEPGAPKLRHASTGQLSVRLDDLRQLSIPLPSLDQQRKLGRAAKSLRLLVSTQERVLDQSSRVLGAFLRERILT
jgi:hypothetical protein